MAGLVHGGYENNVWKQQGGQYGFYDLKGILETVMAQLKLTLEYKKSNQSLFSPGKGLISFLNGEPVGLLGPRVAGVSTCESVDAPTRGSYYGGTVAAPVFSKIMASAMRILHVPPDKPKMLTAAAYHPNRGG